MMYSMFVVILAAIFLSSTTFDVVICGGVFGKCASIESSDSSDTSGYFNYESDKSSDKRVQVIEQVIEQPVQDLRNPEQAALDSLVTITVHRRDSGQFLISCIGVLLEPDIVIIIESCLVNYGVALEVEVSPICSNSWIAHRGNKPIRFGYFAGDHRRCKVGHHLFVMKLPQTAVNRDANFPTIPSSRYFRDGRIIHDDGVILSVSKSNLLSDSPQSSAHMTDTAETETVHLDHAVKDADYHQCQEAFPKMHPDSIVCAKEPQPQTFIGSPYFKLNQSGKNILRGLWLSNTKKLGAYAATFELDVGIKEVVKMFRKGEACGSVTPRE